jgi:hypothetical protein
MSQIVLLKRNKSPTNKVLFRTERKGRKRKNVLVNANFACDGSDMKTTPLVLKCVAALVGVGVLSVPTLKANTQADQSKNMPAVVQQRGVPTQRVILVQTTESRIPKRVVVSGYQVNGASPMFVVQSKDLLRTGATDVTGLVKIDPSITVRH